MKSWAERPTELAYLFNPAYCGWLLREAVEGYASVKPAGMPLPLAFLILPVVLHRPTRELLPRSVATTLHVWLQERPEVRIDFAERARELSPFAREAFLYLGASGHVLIADDGNVSAGKRLGRGKGPLLDQSAEMSDCLLKAKFVGRWFASAGEPATVFQMWGVCP